ncbi:MAG: diacylglycerol kinase [marine bacterium B5-7]|nr:MAG: diacylglycerol kinase [marine bacterium B5-7]
MRNPTTGVKRLVNATVNSANGIRRAFSSEQAVRQEIYLAVVAIPLAFFLTADTVERVLLVVSVILVLLVELLNTAVEYTVDRIGPEYHELSGIAKDIGSAAVLISLCLAAFVWIMIILF